jgi:hypothetical protein
MKNTSQCPECGQLLEAKDRKWPDHLLMSIAFCLVLLGIFTGDIFSIYWWGVIFLFGLLHHNSRKKKKYSCPHCMKTVELKQ